MSASTFPAPTSAPAPGALPFFNALFILRQPDQRCQRSRRGPPSWRTQGCCVLPPWEPGKGPAWNISPLLFIIDLSEASHRNLLIPRALLM